MSPRIYWLHLMLCFAFQAMLIADIAAFHTHSKEFAENGITIIPVRSAELDQLAVQGVAESQLSVLRSIPGLAFIVRNTSQKVISDINVRYRKIPISGGTDVFMTYQIPLTPKRGLARGLWPGKQVVISPSPDLNGALMRKQDISNPSQIIDDILSEFSTSRYSKIAVSVDSVIFDDGLVIGPDEIDVIRQAIDFRTATDSIMREFVGRTAAETPESIRKWLTTVSRDRGHYNKTVGHLDYYKEGAASTARDLLFMMDRLRRDQWVPSIQLKLAATPPTNQPHR